MTTITVGELRSLIREILLREEATVPGRWSGDGEPVDDEELERLGNNGERSPFVEGDDEC